MACLTHVIERSAVWISIVAFAMAIVLTKHVAESKRDVLLGIAFAAAGAAQGCGALAVLRAGVIQRRPLPNLTASKTPKQFVAVIVAMFAVSSLSVGLGIILMLHMCSFRGIGGNS